MESGRPVFRDIPVRARGRLARAFTDAAPDGRRRGVAFTLDSWRTEAAQPALQQAREVMRSLSGTP